MDETPDGEVVVTQLESVDGSDASGLSVGDVYFILFRHKWKILVFSLLGIVAAVAVFGYAMAAGGGWGSVVHSIAESERFGRQFLEPLAIGGTRHPLVADERDDRSFGNGERDAAHVRVLHERSPGS